jgi:hypothetical protein
MQLSNLLLLALALVPLLLLLVAWRAWTKHDRQLVNGTRRTLFLVGTVTTATSLLLYVGFTLQSAADSLAWVRAGFWTGVAGLLLCFFGKGRSRVLGIASAGVMWAVWLLFAWAPP